MAVNENHLRADKQTATNGMEQHIAEQRKSENTIVDGLVNYSDSFMHKIFVYDTHYYFACHIIYLSSFSLSIRPLFLSPFLSTRTPVSKRIKNKTEERERGGRQTDKKCENEVSRTIRTPN